MNSITELRTLLGTESNNREGASQGPQILRLGVALRFYRGWQTNGPQPTLDASMATAITLSGEVGSSVRVDYISQFGPINAWVTLDTVVLTNTTQLYFDVTAFGQPARLNRLAPAP